MIKILSILYIHVENFHLVVVYYKKGASRCEVGFDKRMKWGGTVGFELEMLSLRLGMMG